MKNKVVNITTETLNTIHDAYINNPIIIQKVKKVVIRKIKE